MTLNIDEAKEFFQTMVNEVTPRLNEIKTEQDARFQLINRLLIEVLGWQFADIKTEPHSEAGYADFLLHAKGTPCFVVEAKRTGMTLLDTANPRVATYKVTGPALKSSIDGIRQATRYCMEYGVDFAAVTTGVTWVCFIAFPGGGRSYQDGKAIVFPDLTAVVDNFAYFYDLFSSDGVTKKLYKTRFARAEGLTVSNFESLSAVNRPSDLKMVARSTLAQDLDPVFREFFGVMSGERDRDMLIKCFVETRESRNADEALKKLVGNISAEVETISTDSGRQLAEKISFAVESGYGDSILIVGNKGAGKSTFVERFFKVILESSLRSRCVLLNVDLLDSTGDTQSIHSWITLRVKRELEAAVFEQGRPTFDELQGVYFKEYQRWSEGEFKHLYDSDKVAFKIKFGEFLERTVTADPYGYITRLLENVVNSRKLLPCFVFDNTDHFETQFQEAVFQWSQAIHRETPYSLMIIPITDRTIWRLSKSGPFQTYRSKLFYLPIPSTKEVLKRRVEYLKEHSDNRRGNQSYFFKKGIRLNLKDIYAFAVCMEEVFIREDFISRRIGWLSNHDIRRGLVLSQSVITSPFLSVDDLVAAYVSGGPGRGLTIGHRKFMQALLLGNYNNFQQDESPFILNVFQVNPDFPSSPLLRLSILKLLIDKAGMADDLTGYVPISQLMLYFGSMGVSEEAIISALQSLLDYRLIEPFDASNSEIFNEQRLSITHSGRVHYEMSTMDSIYVSQMAFATPVRSGSVIAKMRSIKNARMGAVEWSMVRRIIVLYCFSEDRAFINIPKDDMFGGQRQLRKDLYARWVTESRLAAGLEGIVGQLSDDGLTEEAADSSFQANHLQCIVKWFDAAKGFGFLDGSPDKDIFVHASVARRAGIELLKEGDRVVCDVALGQDSRRNVIQIHSVEPSASASGTAEEMHQATLAFYNSAKGYGFVMVGDGGEDAYLSATVMAQANLTTLQDGQAVRVSVGAKAVGRGRVITRIEVEPL